MIIDRSTVFDFAGLCNMDPVYIDGFKEALMASGLWEKMGGAMPVVKKTTPPPKAPASTSVTAIRAALWNNWPLGEFVKGHPNQYAMTLELWDLPADDIEAVKVRSLNYAMKTNVSLMGRKSLRAMLKHLRKPRINELSNVDPDYLDEVQAISDANPNMLIGLLNTNIHDDKSEYARGVYYHAYQLVTVEMDGAQVKSANVILSDGITPLSPFVAVDHGGDPLKGKIVGQSRTDLVGFDPAWDSRNS